MHTILLTPFTSPALSPSKLQKAKLRGAPSRNRTGTAEAERFSSHYGFHRQLIAVRALDYALTIATCFRPPPSSLYTFPLGASLGVTSVGLTRGFAEFDGIHYGAFAT